MLLRSSIDYSLLLEIKPLLNKDNLVSTPSFRMDQMLYINEYTTLLSRQQLGQFDYVKRNLDELDSLQHLLDSIVTT